MICKITGKDNKTVKFIKSLKKKSNRMEQGKFVAEGRKLSLEAFEYAAESIYCVVVSEDFAEREPEIVQKAENVCDKVFVVATNVFDEISDTETPQGILAVVNMSGQEFRHVDGTQSIVVLDGVSEPGNLGTVIRTAEAFGFDGVYLMKGCADIYSSKTVRSTMGSVFRMSFKTGCEIKDLKELQNDGFSLVSTTPGGEVSLEQLKAPERCAVIIGNEAHGVSDDVLAISDMRVKITMDGLAESLNAAVAAGIALHWIKNCNKG